MTWRAIDNSQMNMKHKKEKSKKAIAITNIAMTVLTKSFS